MYSGVAWACPPILTHLISFHVSAYRKNLAKEGFDCGCSCAVLCARLLGEL